MKDKLYFAVKFRNGKTIMTKVPNHYYWSYGLRIFTLELALFLVLMHWVVI